MAYTGREIMMRIISFILFFLIVGGLFAIKNSLGVLQSETENIGVCLLGVFIWFVIVAVLYKYVAGTQPAPTQNPYNPPPPQYGYQYQQNPQYNNPYQQGTYQQRPYQQAPNVASYQSSSTQNCRFCGGRLSNVTSTCPHCGHVN